MVTGTREPAEAQLVSSDFEVRVAHYQGAWYVVRRVMHPRTLFSQAGPVIRQGCTILVGIRQGDGDRGGFAVRRYDFDHRLN